MVISSGSCRPFLALCLTACVLVACKADPDPPVAPAQANVESAGAEPMPSPQAAAPADRSASGKPAAATSRQPAPVLEGIPSKIPEPEEDASTPILPVGTEVSYVCENGMPLRIAFAGSLAHVRWTGETRLTLSLAAGAGGGGERYEGDGYLLRRIANVVELSAKEGSDHWRCAEASASG